MSRIKRFAHSLVSGYVFLVANVLYTLASVPLALYYLSRPEFGLWALVTQMAGYIALVDFGLSGAASRILIDYKDHQRREEYGSMIQTGVMVGFSQAGLVLIAGVVLAFVIGPLLRIPSSLEQAFFWLFLGQCVLTAISFAARIFNLILTAHQRFDVYNYTNTALFGVNYGVLWWCFSHGFGVFSMLWAQAAGTVLTVFINGWACHKLELFPRRGEWGRPTWQKFHELFAFGRDLFLYYAGIQLVNTSQTLLLTRLIGLDAAAVWSVCTRTFNFLTPVIYRIFDFSTPALAEMMVRGERERLLQRFREIVQLSASLSVAAGVIFAVCNGTFVRLWTAGKISWAPVNDLLLAVWLLICVSVHAHVGLVGQTKRIQFLRFLYFFEGTTFIGLNLLLHRFGSITTMLLISICCSLCFSFPYGLRRTRAYFGLNRSELARWHRETLVLAIWTAPVAFLIWWVTRSLPDFPRLAVELVVLGTWTAWMFLRHGLSASLREEAARRAPDWIKPFFLRVGLFKSET
jgi:O-antigen/teichoic acid export membrane protein